MHKHQPIIVHLVEKKKYFAECTKNDFQVQHFIPIVYFRFVDGVYQKIIMLFPFIIQGHEGPPGLKGERGAVGSKVQFLQI